MEKILVVDDEIFIRENLERTLTLKGYDVAVAQNRHESIHMLTEGDIDLVLLDLNLGRDSGIDILREMKEVDPEILVIIITGYGTVESAVEALKMGAYDYIKKPFKADALHLIVRLALETRSLKRELKSFKRDGSVLPEVVGVSPAMTDVFRKIREVAKHETATVLITGESGTGKEVVSRAIHNLSPRKDKPFVDINCGSLPYNLLESELFGHEKGAFTDAKTRKIGLLEEAAGGTVFLDEIGEMDMNLQVKFLRVLEERKIRRLGSTRNIDIDVRIIAATNKDLMEAINKKEFREDLFYRLNVFPMALPPLRERTEDIAPLLDHFIKRYSGEFKKDIREVSKEALELFKAYSWPGNIREMKNIVERICIMYEKEIITPDMLPREIAGEKPRPGGHINMHIPADGVDFETMIENIEKQLLSEALVMTGANVLRTSKLLNIPRGTLRYKLEKYGLV
ncbi:sigma-54-dependent transcriptional regulator [Seleniivibrio woodruffii]|uniref:Two component Fis family sigma54 specific transcriptional regulator n=1 Tax=Seleniivibrio woodruffii TaxID=1078050 RepID=A0A4R1KB95_9BACT|nr:sigma-54 dependent transcriptional regulator [Seleniivibrio woodruffii]TCK60419.1 two component Fis family sigma54 specific transcriptional regulator [Seleniivibrio woodruffii]TVZ36047.1 two component, sigma54 specific, transcriptional regulator, Fis family [Seleniivibrio woodruffii]